MLGYTEVNGFLWPSSDQDCRSVVFGRVADLELALRRCHQFRVAVQAGGNAGVWPKYLGGRFGTVYTFEPEPANFFCLAQNCSEPHIVTLQAALGYERTGVSMSYPEGERNMGACQVNGGGAIPMLRIDDLHLAACDFIQLDIEGYEPEAVKGALETIRQYHPVLMCEDKGLSEKYGTPLGWTAQGLATEGYVVDTVINRDVVLVYRG